LGKFYKIWVLVFIIAAINCFSCERKDNYIKIYSLSKIISSSEYLNNFNFTIYYEYNSDNRISEITVDSWGINQKWIKTHEYNNAGEIYKTQICYIQDDEVNCLDPIYYENNEPLLPLDSGTYDLYEIEIEEFDQNGNPTIIIEYYKYTYMKSIIQYDDKINPNATLDVPFRFYPYLYPMNFVELSQNNILSFNQTIYNYDGTKVGTGKNNYYANFEYNPDNYPLREIRFCENCNIVMNFEYNIKYFTAQ